MTLKKDSFESVYFNIFIMFKKRSQRKVFELKS